jgi:restriction system protein
MSVWLVRAGKYGEREQAALEKNVAVIGWNELPDLSSVQSREALADIYRQVHPDASGGKVANHVGQLWAFRDRIQQGNLGIAGLLGRIQGIGRSRGQAELFHNSLVGFRRLVGNDPQEA